MRTDKLYHVVLFFLAGLDNRGELAGGHTHRSTEDSDSEREEIQ